MKIPRVYIIVLSWNRKGDTLECLHSLSDLNYQNYQVILVDNASTDRTCAAVKKLFSRVKIIQNRQNLGYAEGNNIGIKFALSKNADYILVLNNDTLAEPNFLNKLVGALEQDSKIAAASPQIRDYKEKNRIFYGGGKLYWCLASVRLFDKNVLVKKARIKKARFVNFLSGSALFFRSSALKKIGLFEKDYFLYFEETDWCARALKSGYKLLYVPDSVIWHKETTSLGKFSNPVVAYYFFRNDLLFAKRNLAWYAWPIFWSFYFGRVFFWELPLSLLKLRQRNWFYFVSLWAGISDFFAGKFGRRTI